MLKLLEGSLVEVPNKSSRKILKSDTITLDTSNILFVLSGAFVDLAEIVKERLETQTSQLGFNTKQKEKEEKSELEKSEELLKKVENTDLIDYGLIPEFLGRAPVLAVLNELSEQALIAAMTETKNCILKQYQSLFRLNGVSI